MVFDEFPQTLQVNLDGVASDPDDPDEGITYGIVSNSNETALSVEMDGKILVLSRLVEEQAEADLVMRATSDGQFVDFEIHVVMNQVVGVDENGSSFVVYPNPTSGTLTLTVADAQRFDYELHNISGQSVMRGSAVGSEIQLDLGECPKGVYFVSIRWNGNRLIQKVVVK